jgi:hypothetical protein
MNRRDGNVANAKNFWNHIAEEYNATTPNDRTRMAKHCKDKWHKMSTKIRNFNSMWCTVNNLYGSGQVHEELVQNALKLYK